MGTRQLEVWLKRLEERSEGVSERAYARRLRDLEKHLRAAREQPSPALALHRSNARAVLFQLEALTRVHRATIDEETFLPLHVAIKALEDGLGAVDFHDAILKKLGGNGAPGSPSSSSPDPGLRAYFVGRRAEACQNVERHLAREGWWAEHDEDPSDAMDALLDVLEDVRWPGPRKERRQIAEYFADCATRIQDRLAAHAFDFHELESGVHEVRRKVRWLSILPAALDGLFVRDESQPVDPALASYVTPSVMASPYNRFPRRKDVPDPIELDSSAFLAMSWLIAEIGSLKDAGQNAEALTSAARDLDDGAKAATARARKILGEGVPSREAIAHATDEITARFVRDNVLKRLAATAEG